MTPPNPKEAEVVAMELAPLPKPDHSLQRLGADEINYYTTAQVLNIRRAAVVAALAQAAHAAPELTPLGKTVVAGLTEWANGLNAQAAPQAAQQDDKRDAARYRALRDGGNHDFRLTQRAQSGTQVFQQLDGEALDRQMDKALAQHSSHWMTLALSSEQPVAPASLPDVAMPELLVNAQVLADDLRAHHETESWNWDDLLTAASMIDKLIAAQPADGAEGSALSSGCEASNSNERSDAEGSAQVAKSEQQFIDRHGRLKDELRDLIEGMSVSIDVSTGDHDAGHRLFGVVNEVMDDDGDKCGVTLLVYDTTANFAAEGATPAGDALDAKRYRWFKDNYLKYGNSDPDIRRPIILFDGRWYGGHFDNMNDLDTAIDEAMEMARIDGTTQGAQGEKE